MYRPSLLPFLTIACLTLPFSCNRQDDVISAAETSKDVGKSATDVGKSTTDAGQSTTGTALTSQVQEGSAPQSEQQEKATTRPAPPTDKGTSSGSAGTKKAESQEATSKPSKDKPAKEKGTEFSRFVETGKLAGRFETSVVTYKDVKGRTVDLVAAVHIADSPYYKNLQKRMEAYDALLYELVAAKGTVPEKGRKGSSIISQFQRFLKTGLDLDFQLDAIDYKPKNFVHADLSPDEFKKKQSERGETLVGIMLRSMVKGMQDEKEGKGSKITIFHIIAGFFAKDQAKYHKFLFAQELTRMEEMLSSFGDAKGAESTIIGDRNAAFFAVMDEQLAKGKKKIGIFYGAAHLPDMEARLLNKGFKKTNTVWLTAWDLQK